MVNRGYEPWDFSHPSGSQPLLVFSTAQGVQLHSLLRPGFPATPSVIPSHSTPAQGGAVKLLVSRANQGQLSHVLVTPAAVILLAVPTSNQQIGPSGTIQQDLGIFDGSIDHPVMRGDLGQSKNDLFQRFPC